MPLPALRKFENEIERHLRLFELKKGEIERNIGRRIKLFEEKRDGISKKIEKQIRQFERKRGIRLDDEVRFLRSWIERPLSIGAVTPSGKILARTMASYVDPDCSGPVVELGPGTGPVTEALVRAGVAPSRLVLVEFLPHPSGALSRGHFGAGRRLQPAPALGDTADPAGGGGRFGPAAGHQADPHAAAAASRRLRSHASRRTVRAIHLFGRVASAAPLRGIFGGSVRTSLDEHSAGAGVGLSEVLTCRHHRRMPMVR